MWKAGIRCVKVGRAHSQVSSPTPPLECLSYLIYFDDDAIPLEQSMTFGNHLDNDVVVAGEDVGDFHVRMELTDRGPVAIPLGEATCNVNGAEFAQPIRLVIGDTLCIGQATMQVGVEIEMRGDEPTQWFLVDDEGDRFELTGEASVGRADGADLVISDSHISRFHARLIERDGYVWMQDLRSANGSRVNGERILGGVRLFHGDELRFDRHVFQLVGTGGDLTPINSFHEPLKGTRESLPERQTQPVPPPPPALQSAGILRLSSRTQGDDLVLTPGVNRVGNTELAVSADGVRITALAPNQQPLLNGEPVAAGTLEVGDELCIADRSFVLERTDNNVETAGLMHRIGNRFKGFFN